MRCALLALFALTACEGTSEVEEALYFEGRITDDADGAYADVAIRRGFGLATQGQAYVYLAGNADATCDEVVAYLTEDAYDPSQLFTPGGCNITFDFSYDASVGWDGLEYTQADMEQFYSFNCAMGEGSFELQGSGDERDYRYTGRWWQGAPTEHATALSGSGQTLGFALDATSFRGNFIYENFDMRPASGQVSGALDVEWCNGLAQTDFFTP